MDLQPTLAGELVTIRPTVPADWDNLFAVASDPLIWEVHPAHDRWQESVFRKYFEDALASGGGVTILDKASGKIIGASRYAFPDAGRDEIEIGWTFIARQYWGGTYNREIKRLMLDHIHRFVGGAVFVVGQNNIRSRKAMEKIGGVLQEGRIERGDGTPLPDHVYYVIRRAS
ncbi:MAG: GNAT family N-acetyltransferase [Sphingomonas sp.]|uniref:GNAT family N-acetyltransferase n=1 Tax=Sphingomonas sp. TaxID=28214 RepID=UPI0025FEE814|nr:GNAT family N-acetyltransferase [Sphingomonas sp.]MBX3565434.1 GNAT family N-acetyltransferase [Sphingomonas sp.]